MQCPFKGLRPKLKVQNLSPGKIKISYIRAESLATQLEGNASKAY